MQVTPSDDKEHTILIQAKPSISGSIQAKAAGALVLAAIILVLFWEEGVFPRLSVKSSSNMATSELSVAQKQAEVCSSRNATGVGLRGEYFAKTGFQGPVGFSRVDSTVDFDTSLEMSPDAPVLKPQSVRWRGWIRPPISGKYRFHSGNDQTSISVATQVMTGPDAPQDGYIELSAGRYYPIAVEIDNTHMLASADHIKLEWTAPHGMRYVIPRALLFLPSETVSK